MDEQKLQDAIRLYIKYFCMEPKEINNGMCGEFAHLVIQRLGGETEELFESFTQGIGIGHVWITYRNKHYDSECIEGVIDPKQLPFFQRNSKCASLNIYLHLQ